MELATLTDVPTTSERAVIEGESAKEALARCWGDPLEWVSACVRGAKAGRTLAPYQAAALSAIVAPARRVAIRKGRGAGGSTTAALAVLWFATTREAAGVPWKVITTAGSHRQLEKYLWPEVRLWAGRTDASVIGHEPLREGVNLLTKSIKGRHGEAFAVASDKPELIEGGHAEQILVVLDEAAAIPDASWNSLEGTFASATGKRQAYALAISKPADAVGRFYEICTGKVRGWWAQHVSVEQAIAAGRVSTEWVEARKAWGINSAMYRNHVLAEFAGVSSARKVISLVDVERAIERGKDLLDRLVPDVDGLNERARWQVAVAKLPRQTAVSLDVGHGGIGRDPAILARRHGNIVLPLEIPPPAGDMYATEMDLVSRVSVALRRGGTAVVDAIGAAAIVGRLRELSPPVKVFPFIASARSEAKDESGELGFANARAEAWFKMAERLHDEDSDVVLPDDPTLAAELTEPESRGANSMSRLLVESKDDIARRLRGREDREDEGGSTNRADAVVTLWMLGGESSGMRLHQPAPRELSVF